MRNEQRDMMLKTAVLEWQKKYGVQDGDPLLASVELFQIYMRSFLIGEPGDGVSSPSFHEFRESFELIDQRSKVFAKHAAELIEALREVPNIKQQLRSFHAAGFVMTAIAALAAGVLIGRFLL